MEHRFFELRPAVAGVLLVFLFVLAGGEPELTVGAENQPPEYTFLEVSPWPVPAGLVSEDERSRTLGCHFSPRRTGQEGYVPFEEETWSMLLGQVLRSRKKNHFHSLKDDFDYPEKSAFPSEDAATAYFDRENWKVRSITPRRAGEEEFSEVTLVNHALEKLAPKLPATIRIFATADHACVRAIHTPLAVLPKDSPYYAECRKILDVQHALARELADAAPSYHRNFIPGGPIILRRMMEQEWQRNNLGTRLTQRVVEHRKQRPSTRVVLDLISRSRDSESLAELRSDKALIGFSLENVDTLESSYQTIDLAGSPFTYIECYAGGDWEHPLRWILYPDADTLRPRAFVPLTPNPWNLMTRMAFGNGDKLFRGGDVDDMTERLSRLGGPGFVERWTEILREQEEQDRGSERLFLVTELMNGRDPNMAYQPHHGNLRPARSQLKTWLEIYMKPKP